MNNENDYNNKENKTVVDKVLHVTNEAYRLVGGLIKPPILGLMDLIERGKISKKIAVFAGIGLTVYSLLWCMDFAVGAPAGMAATGIAAIIGAILTPVAGLTGALMKYGEQEVIIKQKETVSGNRDQVDG